MKAVKKKLDQMLKGKEKDIYVLAIISSLFERSRDNPALAKAIPKDDKTWNGCWKYITDKARKEAVNNCACIADNIVYDWAVEYFLEESPSEVKSEAPAGIPKPRKTSLAKAENEEEDEDKNQYGQLRMNF